MARRQMSRADVAEYLRVKPDTITRYLSEDRREIHNFPEPDGKIGGSPYWWSTTIEKWEKRRPGAGTGGGRRRADPLSVACPACGAEAGTRCRSLVNEGRVRNSHRARLKAAVQAARDDQESVPA